MIDSLASPPALGWWSSAAEEVPRYQTVRSFSFQSRELSLPAQFSLPVRQVEVERLFLVIVNAILPGRSGHAFRCSLVVAFGSNSAGECDVPHGLDMVEDRAGGMFVLWLALEFRGRGFRQ